MLPSMLNQKSRPEHGKEERIAMKRGDCTGMAPVDMGFVHGGSELWVQPAWVCDL